MGGQASSVFRAAADSSVVVDTGRAGPVECSGVFLVHRHRLKRSNPPSSAQRRDRLAMESEPPMRPSVAPTAQPRKTLRPSAAPKVLPSPIGPPQAYGPSANERAREPTSRPAYEKRKKPCVEWHNKLRV